jgi:acetyl/propionyl-CoA carboxylase alpha subunit/acetyl-CoA carboxylase carboxyltransferase component
MKRIAIVNRGEAAGRCIRAIRELRLLEGSELTSIALYTEPDRGAPFVRQADVAISLGAALRVTRDGRARPAYLDRARVLAALRAARADAVWPGWGFVAEDADFVAALEERGLVFIGPPSGAIRAVGDKIAAKLLAERAGVAVAPWSRRPLTAGDGDAAAAARDLGYPLMVKASAGGGGRGIRTVRREEDLADALAAARAEAGHAFGNDAVYLEAYLDRPRHIEVQIAADRHGNVFSFGLRDCSIQRRHQKILEESPPPAVSAETAAAIESAAVAIARAAGYEGVGTVEFLAVDGNGDRPEFYFLEVNPRLQVEHGVTETLVGCDLVATQIRIARGEVLAAPAAPRGHAIEARVCAEDPHAGFAPAPGRIALIDLPTGPGVRTDCSAAIGTSIPAEFDSLVAKVIAHGPDRAAALARLRAALGDFRLMIDGGSTNKGFLLNLLDDAEVRGGAVDVGWLDRNLPRLVESHLAPQALIVAAILTYLGERAIQRLNFFAEASRGEPQSIPAASGQSVDLGYRGGSYSLRVLALGDWRYRVDLDERTCIAELLDQEERACQLAIGEDRYTVEYTESPSSLQIEIDGHRHVVERNRGGEVRATAPSVVVSIEVAAGDRVAAGQRIGILETMKIEIAVAAPLAGIVQEVRARPNQRVAAGDVLLLVQPDAGGGESDGARVALPADDEAPPAFADAYSADRYVRERARRAIAHTVRRLLLGYDTEPEEVAEVRALLDAPLPAGLDDTVLRELAEIRSVVGIFADTETLFSRQPGATGDGGAIGSNDARLRRYLRRVEAAGTGLSPEFRRLLERALRHYKVDDLTPSEGLQRALLRLYAARRQRPDRHRVVETVLRHFGRLLQAGLRIGGESDEPEFAAALGTCLVLRGDVPDALADAAAEVRAACFETPEVERRTMMAAQAVDALLAGVDSDPGAAFDPAMTRALADSAPPIFDTLIEDSQTHQRRVLATQALVLRAYTPATPRRAAADATALIRLALDDDRVIYAILLAPGELAASWDAICATVAAGGEATALEVFVRFPEPTNEEELRRLADAVLRRRPVAAGRVSFTAVQRRQPETAATWQPGDGWLENGALHPETPRRIGLPRLAQFEIRRLPAPRPLFAFHARSRDQPEDQRLFVYGEVHAAVPGFSGTLHEASFVRVFNEAARTLRRLRSEEPQWQRLHWNRLDLRLRPAFHLTEATLQRLLDELLPATRHLGLERILVRVELYEPHAPQGSPGHGPAQSRPPRDSAVVTRELSIEPGSSGAPRVTWRAPHDAPLEPADKNARRVAAARRRGLVDPYEAIRLFNSGRRERDHFAELELGDDGAVRAVARPAGENTAAVVFGISTAHTDKHPEGRRRVTILSDPTRNMAALTAAECDRIVAAIDLADRRGWPVEWFATSSGARIAMDSGTENLDAVADVVRRIVRFTQSGGEINIVVTGTNVGAQSYWDALATMLMHTRGILIMTQDGSMVLTGKRALDASGAVSAEDERAIGGFEDIMGPNGQAQYYARDLADAFDILMRHYELTSPRRHLTADPRRRNITTEPCRAEDWSDAPPAATVGDYLGADENPGRKKPFSIRPVMRALIDADSDWLERWAAMRGGETAVVWDSHLGGHPICLIGVENRALPRDGHAPPDGPAEWAGATLFPRSSKKIARTLNAASGRRPVVILANLAGFDGSPESMRELQLEYGAEIARAVVNFRGPIFFVVTSRFHGGAYVVFSTRLNDGLHAIALEGAYASVIGGGPAATVIFGDRVRRLTDQDPRVVALRRDLGAAVSRLDKAAIRSRLATVRAAVQAGHHAAVAAEFDRIHSVERALQVGSIDEIVAAADLRRVLIEHLDRAAG